MLYLVSYDVIDNSKRTKLAKKLGDYGQRVQYSVFECSLTAERYEEMKEKALVFIDLKKDSLRIYQICGACSAKIASFGIKRGWQKGDDERIIVI